MHTIIIPGYSQATEDMQLAGVPNSVMRITEKSGHVGHMACPWAQGAKLEKLSQLEPGGLF